MDSLRLKAFGARIGFPGCGKPTPVAKSCTHLHGFAPCNCVHTEVHGRC